MDLEGRALLIAARWDLGHLADARVYGSLVSASRVYRGVLGACREWQYCMSETGRMVCRCRYYAVERVVDLVRRLRLDVVGEELKMRLDTVWCQLEVLRGSRGEERTGVGMIALAALVLGRVGLFRIMDRVSGDVYRRVRLTWEDATRAMRDACVWETQYLIPMGDRDRFIRELAGTYDRVVWPRWEDDMLRAYSKTVRVNSRRAFISPVVSCPLLLIYSPFLGASPFSIARGTPFRSLRCHQ